MRFQLEDLVDIHHPSDVQLSPNGDYAVFVFGQIYKADKDTPPEKALYVVDVASGETRRLTGSNTRTNESPRWSSDGRHIAFLSNRANSKEMQLYVMPLQGGEALALTDLRGSVRDSQWSPDGKHIAFLYNGMLDKEKPKDPDPIVIDADPMFNRVWLIDVGTQAIRAVTPETCHIHEYALSPDGTQLALVVSSHPNPMQGWYSAQLYVMPVAGGDMRQVCTIKNQMGRLTWSPDSTQIACVCGVMSDEGNVAGEVFLVAASGGEAHNVTPGIDHSITWIDWRDAGILYGARHIEATLLGWIDPQSGTTRLITHGMFSINGGGPEKVSAISNTTFAAVRDSFTEVPNIYVGSLERDEWRQLTHLDLDMDAFPPLRVENKHWSHADGTPTHGWLVFPPDYEAGKPYPLVANVHGGPSLSIIPRYVNAWVRLFIERGCLVLLPNPRGSWGRGHAYQAANVGDLGGGDWQDITAGIDLLIEEGLVDPERMAIAGWSYAGFLTTWAVTQTDRFRCAIAGANITNYESNYGVVLNREWQTTMFGSNVYEDFDLHRSRSPIAYVNRVKTPTLLVHGVEDNVAPPQQSIEFYVALRHFGVTAQLALYPREPHGFRERAHVLDLYQRMGAWLDRFLLNDETE